MTGLVLETSTSTFTSTLPLFCIHRFWQGWARPLRDLCSYE